MPRLPRKTKVDVTKCHACHAKRRQMSASATENEGECHQATPATQNEGGCHQVPPMPATRNEIGCQQVPRLPRKTKVDVTKCHACHAKWRGAAGDQGTQARGQARHQSQPSTSSATPATQNEGKCHQVPRLPRETKVDVSKCHACHAKSRGAPGDQARPSARQNDGGCHQVPHLPRKTKADVTK